MYVPIPRRSEHVPMRSPRRPAVPMRPTNAAPTPPEAPEPELQSPVTQHRQERFTALGFTEVDAALLAHAKGDDGFPLYHGQVKLLLDADCTHAQVVRLYA